MGELNTGQSAAALAIKLWFEHNTSAKQTFVLAGYAGTGKTYLIDYTIKNLLDLDETDVAFITPTGKAASVLIQRGRNASTIHRLIYNIVEKESVQKVGDKEVKISKKVFVRKTSIPNYKLLVIDEISMVDAEIMEDLLSFGIPILCSGDLAQLPPIMKSNKLLENPDVELTEVVRQSADNSIIKIATDVRNGKYVAYGNYGDVLVLNYDNLSDVSRKKLFVQADQVLCGKNSTRVKLNETIRGYKGISNRFPQDGEKIICNVNNWEVTLDADGKYNLVNGTMGYASNFHEVDPLLNLATISINPDFLPNTCKNDVLVDSGIFKNNTFTYDMHQRAYHMPDGSYLIKNGIAARSETHTNINEYLQLIKKEYIARSNADSDEQIEQIDFGYAISVHKSQGSEWPIVVVLDESRTFGKDANKWLYTAITRAKKKLIILR